MNFEKENQTKSNSFNENQTENKKVQEKVWKQYDSPIRSFTLWGWYLNQPSYLVLYGIQPIKQYQNKNSILEPNVTYTNYAIFSGQDGHLPPVTEEKVIFYSNTLRFCVHYILSSSTWQTTKSSELYTLKNSALSFPYEGETSYFDLVNTVKQYSDHFLGFQFAASPNEILQLDPEYEAYFSDICEMMCSPNRYIRKKKLNYLLSLSFPLSFYQRLLKVGSVEFISGLFLAFAKQKNPILLEDSEKLLQQKPFAQEAYFNGMKRCIRLYQVSISPEESKKRIAKLQEEVVQIDLPVIEVDGVKIPSGTQLEGSVYYSYALKGYLSKTISDYVYSEKKNRWEWVSKKVPPLYQKGIYNDGWTLNLLQLKNTIQEAEIYDLPEILGKIAYYLDAPRLYYYFTGNNLTKAKNYFTRYLRRTLDEYAKTDEEKFIRAMKVFLTSYKKQDYLSKYKGNFQENKLLKYYLYYYYKIQPPKSLNGWAMNSWKKDMKKSPIFLKAEGRFEAYPEIWNKHLKEAADIAIASEVKDIVKACYYILKDAMDKELLFSELTIQQLISMLSSCYEPLTKLAAKLLQRHFTTIEYLEPDLLFSFLQSSIAELYEIAINYLEKTTNSIPMDFYIRLFCIEQRSHFFSIWSERILAFTAEEFMEFLCLMIEKREELHSLSLTQEEDVILQEKAFCLNDLDFSKKQELFNLLFTCLFYEKNLSEFFIDFIEMILLSFSIKDLEKLYKEIEMTQENIVSITSIQNNQLFENNQQGENNQQTESNQHGKGNQQTENNLQIKRKQRILIVLQTIIKKEIPDAAQIEDMFKNGSSKLLHLFLEIVKQNKESLFKKESLLERKRIFLLFAETQITAYNIIAEEILIQTQEPEKKEFLTLLLNSPIPSAYQIGLKQLEEVHKDHIPKEWLIMLLEHPKQEVKSYLTKKIEQVLDGIAEGSIELFFYYIKTILYAPNKASKEKTKIYQILPDFILNHPEEKNRIQEILLDLGGSNCKIDAERALVALAQIKNIDSSSVVSA